MATTPTPFVCECGWGGGYTDGPDGPPSPPGAKVLTGLSSVPAAELATAKAMLKGSLLRQAVQRSHGPSPRGGPPKKGVNKANKDFFLNFSEIFRVLKLRFLAFPGGPGGFEELRGAGRKHFHLSW